MGTDNNLTRSEATPQLSVVTQSGLWGEKHHTMTKVASRSLAERFVIPPFSVFDARQGYWQERKRLWISRGIKSEIGRGTDGDGTTRGLVFASSAQPPSVYKKKNEYEAKVGRVLTWEEFYEIDPGAWEQTGTSIFDPVLCEVMYSWFCPPGGAVLDPFAGHNSRMEFTVMEGRHYIGYDVSQQFMEYNRSIVGELREETGMNITLYEANSEVMGYTMDEMGDFTITSPPYWDLEFYGDEAEQLGYKKPYPEFLDGLQKVAFQNFRVLRPGAFCVWIVNDFRKRGQFYSFHTDTLELLQQAGFVQHDIMIIDYGSPIRAAFATQLIDTLILPKQHEYALVMKKGEASIEQQ